MEQNDFKTRNEGSSNQEIINRQLFNTLEKQGDSINSLEKSSKTIDELLFGKKNEQTGERTTTGLVQENAKQREYIKSSKDHKIDFIAIGGVFVSIFTFVSIEIQILKYVCDFWRIAGFSLIILGSLSSFSFLIQYIAYKAAGKQQKMHNKGHLFLLCIVPLILGLLCPLGNLIYKDSCTVYEKDLQTIENRIDLLEHSVSPVKKS